MIYSLCEASGDAVRPWAERGGAQCECIDMLNDGHIETFPSGGSIKYTQANILFWVPSVSKAIYFAFPPCTHLAVTGSRHFKNKGLSLLIEGLTLVERCRVLCEEGRWFQIENPVGTLSTYWRKPNYIIQPNEYAGYLGDNTIADSDCYTKKTCLWVSDNYFMAAKIERPAWRGSIVHEKLRDAQERALFPKGFALATYLNNKHILDETGT